MLADLANLTSELNTALSPYHLAASGLAYNLGSSDSNSYLTCGSSTTHMASCGSGSGNATWTLAEGYTDQLYLTATVSSVPEPASLALLGVGMIGTGVIARRRKYT